MKQISWYERWSTKHPNASMQEYAEALNRHVVVTSICASVISTTLFIAVVYLASFA